MKILTILFCVLFILMFLFAEVKVNGRLCNQIFQRVFTCLVGSLIFTLVLGFPVLGIMYLIKEL